MLNWTKGGECSNCFEPANPIPLLTDVTVPTDDGKYLVHRVLAKTTCDNCDARFVSVEQEINERQKIYGKR